MAEVDPKQMAEGLTGLQMFEAQYGPFAPEHYQFEPELQEPAPRRVLPELYDGPYRRKQRLGFCALLFAGVVMGILSFLPITQIWGLYLLPLAYLHWIALGCLVFGVIGWVRYLTVKGPFVYIEEGEALVVRIIGLNLRTKLIVNGVPSTLEYLVDVQYLDPTTNELTLNTAAHDIQASAKGKVDLSYRVGDYATAVYLRSNPAKTFRLYGFLGLRDHLGIVPVGTNREWNLLHLIGTIAALGLFFFALCWNVYALGKYGPIEWTWQQGVTVGIGAVLIGAPFLLWIAWESGRTQRKQAAKNATALATGGVVEIPVASKLFLGVQGCFMGLIMLFGGLLLSGMTFFCWCLTLNALLDTSKGQERPVNIRDLWVETHSFLFRNYQIDYEFADDPKREKQQLMTTPWHLNTLLGVPKGTASVRAGYFGWPWVETINPVLEEEPDNREPPVQEKVIPGAEVALVDKLETPQL